MSETRKMRVMDPYFGTLAAWLFGVSTAAMEGWWLLLPCIGMLCVLLLAPLCWDVRRVPVLPNQGASDADQ